MTFWWYVPECMATTLSIRPVCFGIQVDGCRSPFLYLHESNEGSLLTRVPRVLNSFPGSVLDVSWKGTVWAVCQIWLVDKCAVCPN